MIPKFRAWDTFRKKWVEHFYITENGLIYNMMQMHIDRIGAVPIEKSGLIVMQFTGLFDVEDNEIFEGDVVVVLDGMYTVFYDEKTASFRLKPHDKRWHTDYMSNYAHSDSFEVIGNIYENPEFLEEVE